MPFLLSEIFYIYRNDLDYWNFAKLLVKEAKVAVSSEIGFGDAGEGFVRFAVIENEERIRQATRGIKNILNTHSA